MAWQTVDRRVGEKFTFDNYTRSFAVPRPQEYSHYRLVFDAAGGVTLAELELLGTLAGPETGDHPSKRELERRKPKPGPSESIERNYG